jgi:hypothetical protein
MTIARAKLALGLTCVYRYGIISTRTINKNIHNNLASNCANPQEIDQFVVGVLFFFSVKASPHAATGQLQPLQ